MKIEKTFFQIVTTDGTYISRNRWATFESAQAELDANSDTWPKSTHKVAEISYSFEV